MHFGSPALLHTDSHFNLIPREHKPDEYCTDAAWLTLHPSRCFGMALGLSLDYFVANIRFDTLFSVHFLMRLF